MNIWPKLGKERQMVTTSMKMHCRHREKKAEDDLKRQEDVQAYWQQQLRLAEESLREEDEKQETKAVDKPEVEDAASSDTVEKATAATTEDKLPEEEKQEEE